MEGLWAAYCVSSVVRRKDRRQQIRCIGLFLKLAKAKEISVLFRWKVEAGSIDKSRIDSGMCLI